MQLYTNSVQDRYGNALRGAQITVRTAAGVLATLYADNGVTLATNPLTADATGEFRFYAANGRYTFTVTASGMQAEIVSAFEMQDALELQAAVAGGAAQVAADRIVTGQDKAATAADRLATAADRVITTQDKGATAADRLVTAADRAATGLDKAAALATRTAIDNRYRGALAADPATRLDGMENQLGDEYFNSATSRKMVFRATGWQDFELNASASAAAALSSANASEASRQASGVSAGLAATAKTAAEAARDSAIIGAGVYTTEALGRAAVLDGAAFKVQGSGDVAAFEYRRINASVSALIATYPSGGLVSDISTAFSITPPKNKYNPALAEDGRLYDFVTGSNDPFANGIVSGRVPVVLGVSYTASLPSDEKGFYPNVYCWNAAGAYLGMAALVSTNAVVAGMALSFSDPGGTGGYRKVTFTVPAGSGIATVGFSMLYLYAVHTGAEFTRIKSGMQLEIGAAVTAFEAYAILGRAVLKASAALFLSPTALSVTKVGGDVYIKGEFDSSRNIVQRVTLETGTAWTNDTVNVQGARTAIKSVDDDVTAWAGGTELALQGDSSAPLQYNNTYIGANHGAFIVREVTATAHGKAVQDVGSEWTDGAAVKWYLMRVVDVNRLWFVSQNFNAFPSWSFSSAITGATLTHSLSATNIGSITIASSVGEQLIPCLQSQTKTVLLDGVRPVTVDGAYRCTTVDIVNAYNIANPASVLAYVRSQVGSAVQPSFIHASIAADVRRTLTYKYAENGSCTVIDGVRNFNSVTMGYFGATQAEPLTYAGKQLWQYIPRTLPIVGGIKTWNFAAQENIGGTFEQLTLGAANWSDLNNAPDRMAQIVKTAGVAEFGMMLGYSPVRSVGMPALRKTLINEACFVSAIRKQYPKAVNGVSLTANTYFEIVAFRAFWATTTNPEATCFTWYRDGKSVIVVADFHQTVSLSKLALPAQFTGMDVAVVDKTASATVHGNGVVTPDGVLVSVTGGYGYLVLKLS